MKIVRSLQFISWLATLTKQERAVVDDGLEYLNQFGREAALPDVRHRIQTSRHFPDMSEMRVECGRRYLRVLVAFASADTLVVLVGGDKTNLGNAWYDLAIPLADELFDKYLDAHQ